MEAETSPEYFSVEKPMLKGIHDFWRISEFVSPKQSGLRLKDLIHWCLIRRLILKIWEDDVVKHVSV